MKVITDTSIWIFDEDSKMFSRFPKNEGVRPQFIPYSYIGNPRPYLEIERGFFHGGDRVKVTAVESQYDCYTGQIKEIVDDRSVDA